MKKSELRKIIREVIGEQMGAQRLNSQRPSPPRNLRLPQYSEEELTNIIKGFRNENQFKAWYDREFGPWLQYVPEIPSADELIRSVPGLNEQSGRPNVSPAGEKAAWIVALLEIIGLVKSIIEVVQLIISFCCDFQWFCCVGGGNDDSQ